MKSPMILPLMILLNSKKDWWGTYFLISLLKYSSWMKKFFLVKFLH